MPQGVSRHLEYTFQDWCLARLAEHAGDAASAARFDGQAKKLWNLWRDDLQTFAPKGRDGAWHAPFHPDFTRPDCWNDPFFYEGSARQWSWNTQHDVAGLVRRMGGPAGFTAALDTFFSAPEVNPAPGPVGQTRRSRYASKETMLHVPYLYHYAGRPDRTADTVRAALTTYFQPVRKGLHDNEDMGCQSAFYLASALGFYPLFGQDVYLLTTPVFTRSVITLGAQGKQLVIHAPGAGADRPYIVGARLNGQPLHRAWLRHGEIAEGAVLEFELAATPGTWGTTELPPSYL